MLSSKDRDDIRIRAQREIARISFMRIRAITSHPVSSTSEEERAELRFLTEKTSKQSETDRNQLSDNTIVRRVRTTHETEAGGKERWCGVINSGTSSGNDSEEALDHEWGELIVDMTAAQSIGTK